MFWGATLEGGKKYAQKVEQAFQVTTAALKVPVPQQDAEKIYPVYVSYNGKEFLLCSLSPSSGIYQVALGLQFEAGAKIEFRVEGGGSSSRVYLTGYTMSSQEPSLHPALASTPFSSSAIAIPIKAQQSILVSGKKKAKQPEKRVSIQDYHEEKTFEKDSSDDEDEDELGSAEENEDGIFEELDESDEDMFDLDDSEDDDDDEGDTDELPQEELADEEESFFSSVEVVKTNGNVKGRGDKKNKKTGKLNFSEVEPSPKSVKDDKKPSSPPTKKQKMDDSKNKTPPQEVMKTPETKKHLKPPSSAGHTPMKILTKGGVMITENKIGNGTVAKAGRKVKVNYVGRLKKNDHVFDRGDIGFHLGRSEVIKGWDIGIEGMKVGGKRKLVIPPHLAYGKTGAPPDIPPNSTLVFDVELNQA